MFILLALVLVLVGCSAPAAVVVPSSSAEAAAPPAVSSSLPAVASNVPREIGVRMFFCWDHRQGCEPSGTAMYPEALWAAGGCEFGVMASLDVPEVLTREQRMACEDQGRRHNWLPGEPLPPPVGPNFRCDLREHCMDRPTQ